MRQKPYQSRKSNSIDFFDTYVDIHCNGGAIVKVDLDDYEKIKHYHCYAHRKCAVVQTEKGAISLSRFILHDMPPERKILHRNKDGLDCRKKNLFAGNIYVNYVDYYVGECFDGRTFKIDAEDYKVVSKYVWHIDKNGYVTTKSGGRVIKQHRLILGVIDNPTIEIDHKYNDTTDNRKEYLRIVTRSQNCRNRRPMNTNTSGTPGVYWNKSANKWCAQINVNGVRKYLGSYSEKEDAVAARKRAEVKYPI